MSYTEVFLLVFAMVSFFLFYMKCEILKDKIQRLERTVRRHDKELKEPVQIEVIDYAEHDLNERW